MEDIGGKSSFVDGREKGEQPFTLPKTRRGSAHSEEFREIPTTPLRRMSGEFSEDTQPIVIEKYVYRDGPLLIGSRGRLRVPAKGKRTLGI